MIVSIVSEEEVASTIEKLQRGGDFVLREAVERQTHVVSDGSEMINAWKKWT